MALNPKEPTAQELEVHRDYLYRYALLQLRDSDGARDAVQETLLSAIQARSSFAGRSSLKTWLTGILKHKITDSIRKQLRDAAPVHVSGEDAADAREYADTYFDQARSDHWHSPPRAWADPVQSLEQKRFWEAFERCIDRLPEQCARVFAMRELMGMSTEDICKELGISPTNCWVILYRARMGLRECLDQRWFGNDPAGNKSQGLD